MGGSYEATPRGGHRQMSTYAEKIDMNEQPRGPADTDEERAAFLKWWEGQACWSGSACAVAYQGWLAAKVKEHAGTKAVYERAHMLERELAEARADAEKQRDLKLEHGIRAGDLQRDNAALRAALQWALDVVTDWAPV